MNRKYRESKARREYTLPLLPESESQKLVDDLHNQIEFTNSILNSTDDHLAVVGPDGTILEVNDAWRRFARDNGAGDEATWNVGANYFRSYSEDYGDTSNAQEAYDGLRQVQQGKLSHFEVEYPCNSPGEKRWFLMRVLPLVGRPGTVLVFHTDLTRRKNVERALRHEKEFNAALLESMSSGVVACDAEGKLTLVNRVAREWYGLSSVAVLHKESILSSDLYYADGVTPMPFRELPLTRAFHGEVVRDVEMVIRTKNQAPRQLLVNAVPFFDEHGQKMGAVTVMHDITEIKQAEDEKRRFYSETIKSVTQSKLNLVSSQDVEHYVAPDGMIAVVASAADVSAVRHRIKEFLNLDRISEDRWAAFEMAIGEALVNAIKHAGGGQVYAGTRPEANWVAVSDDGPGIANLTLPGAILRRGFSTQTSMGVGYTVILDACDEVLLCTGPQGTIVVLLMNTIAQDFVLPLNDLPDTWNTIPQA